MTHLYKLHSTCSSLKLTVTNSNRDHQTHAVHVFFILFFLFFIKYINIQSKSNHQSNTMKSKNSNAQLPHTQITRQLKQVHNIASRGIHTHEEM